MRMPVSIAEVLQQYGDNCPALEGAVVATHDGLVLGATDSFMGDTPAAAAASLCVHLEQDLSLVLDANLKESLVWVNAGVWYLCRLHDQHLLLARCQQESQAGALRLAGQIAAQQLAPMLAAGA